VIESDSNKGLLQEKQTRVYPKFSCQKCMVSNISNHDINVKVCKLQGVPLLHHIRHTKNCMHKILGFSSVCILVLTLGWRVNTDRTFYRPEPYPMQKKITKNPLNFYFSKVKVISQ